jgi:hypothetical protein
MKKFLMTVFIVTFVFSICGAKKKDLAGEVENAVYTDNTYHFSLAMPDAWSYSLKKSKGEIRLILTKKQYDTPIQFQQAPNYTTAPRIIVYVDTTSLTTDQFVDSLLSEKFKSKQKNRIISEFKILNGPFLLKKRSKMEAGGISGVRIAGQQRYTIEVQRSGSESDRGDVVTDFYGGSIFFAKEGNNIVIMHMICEWRYFDVLEQDFIKIIDGLTFPKK